MELKKQHNTAETSKESFKDVLNSGQIKREKEVVIECLNEHQPITARQVSYKTGIEKSNITRALYDLVKSERAKVAFIAKCPTTQKCVGYYTLIDWVAKPEYQQAA